MIEKSIEEYKTQIFRLSDKTSRLEYVLKNFKGIYRAQQLFLTIESDSSCSDLFPGYIEIVETDKAGIATILCNKQWSGQEAESACFIMADAVFNFLERTCSDPNRKWELGRVLLSAFTYAGIYTLESVGFSGKTSFFIADPAGNECVNEMPDRTSFEPFPSWTKNYDHLGNILVRPRHRFQKKMEYIPTIKSDTAWLKAVHKLENTPFKINKELLAWAKEIDKNENTRLVRREPPVEQYSDPRQVLDRLYKKQGLEKLETLYEKEKPARIEDARYNRTAIDWNKTLEKRAKKNKKRVKVNDLLPLRRSQTRKLTLEQEQLWEKWKYRSDRLENLRQSFIFKRAQYEREIAWASKLANADRLFYHRVCVDHTGRLILPDFSCQGSDFCRAVIEFAGSNSLTQKGFDELCRYFISVKDNNSLHDASYLDGELDTNDWFEMSGSKLAIEKLVKNTEVGDLIYQVDKPFCFYRLLLEFRNNQIYQDTCGGKSFLDISNGSTNVNKKTENELITHLPVIVDRENTALIHTGLMMGGKIEKKLVKQANMIDLYAAVGNKTKLIMEYEEKKKIIEMIMIPWSYGEKKQSCLESLMKFRSDHTAEVPYIDNLSEDGLVDLVNHVYNVLEEEFTDCYRFRKSVKDIIGRTLNKHPNTNIIWVTASGFEVYLNAYKAEDCPGKVANGITENLVTLTTKKYINQIDRQAMEDESVSNLICSQEATVNHFLLAGIQDDIGEKLFNHVNPVTLVDNSYAALPGDVDMVIEYTNLVTEHIYCDDACSESSTQVVGEDFSTKDNIIDVVNKIRNTVLN